MNIVREDPPGRANHRNDDYHKIAGKLKADPGNWYKIFEDTPRMQMATYIKYGRTHAFRPPGSFEATLRSNGTGTGTYTVWARYVGEEGQP